MFNNQSLVFSYHSHKELGTEKYPLKNGGYIAGSVPNRERFLISLMKGRRDLWGYPPNHFLWFSKAVLRCFLHREGFDDILVVPINISLSSLAQNIEYVITGSSFTRKKLKVKY
jgi:hypothetical protein